MDNELPHEFLKTAITAAELAGEIILKNIGTLSTTDIQSKLAFDFVTKVDKWSEAVIMKTIQDKFPSHSFLAEETLKQEEDDNYRWIIDPLDGTTNYIHGFPVFSVSIALEYKRKMVVGVVFDPLHNELFHAVKDSGSFLNNNPLQVSDIRSLRHSLITTGFPFRNRDMIDLYLEVFKKIFGNVSDLRRAGSAALDLAYLASGRCDGFFEIGLSPWDVAAGSLLIQEAGGIISDFGDGNEYLSTGNIVAGNKHIHSKILKIIKQGFKGIIEK